MKKSVVFFALMFACFLLTGKPVHALKFNLIQPNPQVNRGDTIKFQITVDTEGQSMQSTSIGISYTATDLQFVSAEPGNTFANISATTGTAPNPSYSAIIVSANSPSAYSGSGTFAYVNFKLIATSPGSTQLCSLFSPVTATAAPTAPKSTQGSTPSALPKTGSVQTTVLGGIAGMLLVAMAALVLLM